MKHLKFSSHLRCAKFVSPSFRYHPCFVCLSLRAFPPPHCLGMATETWCIATKHRADVGRWLFVVIPNRAICIGGPALGARIIIVQFAK